MKNKWLDIRESTVSLLRILALLLVLVQLSAAGILIFEWISYDQSWDTILWFISSELALAVWYGAAVFALSWVVYLIGRQDETDTGKSWWHNKEKSICLLKKAAALIVLLYLLVIGIGMYTTIDRGDSWDNTVGFIMQFFTQALFYGGIVFALSWIVSRIGRQDETDTRGSWWNNKEKSVFLLKKLAASIVLLGLPLAVLTGFIQADSDWDWGWASITDSVLYVLFTNIFNGCVVFALAWVVSSIGQSRADKPDEITELHIKRGWLNIRESSVSLLRILALLLVLNLLARTGLSVYQSVDGSVNGIGFISTEPWYEILRIILEGIATAVYYGGTVFVLSWVVSLTGRQSEITAGSSWWSNREKVISLLKKVALSIILLYLIVIIIKMYTTVDRGQDWDDILETTLSSIAKAVYYGGTIFALSWIVSLISRRDEVNVGIVWMDNREKAVSLLKYAAVSIVLFQLAIAVLNGFIDADWDEDWIYSFGWILRTLATGIFQGLILFALAWVVSLIGEKEGEKAGNAL